MSKEEIITCEVQQDGIEVQGVDRDKGDLVDIPKNSEEFDILTRSGLIETTDKNTAAEESPKNEKEEVEDLEEENEEDDDGMTVTVKPGGLSEGSHKGTIIDLNKREIDVGSGKTANYIDVIIDVPLENGDSAQVKPSYPMDTVTKNSKLGKLLERFTGKVEVDDDINLEQTLIEEPVKFLVEEGEDGYSNVLRETVKPATNS